LKLLIVSHYFWPETFIINDLADRLSQLGHQVTVFTGKPNYPEGKIYEGYQQAGISFEKLPSGVEVHRVPLRPRGVSSGKNLALNYLSFLFSGLLRFPLLARGREFDSILVFAPSPMTSAITAIPLKCLKRAHLAIWVQDLWPESLSATGHVKNSLILSLVKQMVRLIYWAADSLLIQSRAFFEPVAALTDANKIAYVPNFSRAIESTSQTDEAQLPADLLDVLKNHFCIVFAGNLGTAQSLDTVLDAAEEVSDLSEIKVVLVGSGSLSGWLERQIRERKLNNVLLAGRLPPALMPALYQLSAGLLVTLKDQEIFAYTIPSKVQGYMAAGRPIIAAINGEAVTILQESGAGFAGPAEDSEALAGNIRKLYHLPPESRIAMGERGFAYFKQHFEMDSQIDRLIQLLQQKMDIKQV
jgi:glycosyltransferase involved in cell wall biosynthesis